MGFLFLLLRRISFGNWTDGTFFRGVFLILLQFFVISVLILILIFDRSCVFTFLILFHSKYSVLDGVSVQINSLKMSFFNCLILFPSWDVRLFYLGLSYGTVADATSSSLFSFLRSVQCDLFVIVIIFQFSSLRSPVVVCL